MSCEFYNRCKNNKRCLRCFNQRFLELPEDKIKKQIKSRAMNKKRQTEDKKDQWESLEQDVASDMNIIPTISEARRSLASGALWFEKTDVVADLVSPECKMRKGKELKSGEQSISIQRGWLEKAAEESKFEGKTMMLPFRYKGDSKYYVIFESDDINQLIGTAKAYMIDNDAKSKEIEILKKRIEEQDRIIKNNEL